jgi:hypothetical protein
MYGAFSILFFICIIVLILYIGHFIWDYLRDTYTPKVTKDMYNIQVEKYKRIVEELQQAHTETQEKIDMEDELSDYIEHHLDEIRL